MNNKALKKTKRNFLSQPLTYTLTEVKHIQRKAYDAGLYTGLKEASDKSFQEGFDFAWNSKFKLNKDTLMDQLDIQIRKCLDAIELFNKIAGNLDAPVNYELEYSMLKSEVLEYYEASIEGKEVDQKDALADIMVVLWGSILKHGWKSKFFSILTEVCKSNLSKFPETADDAQATVQKYLSEGVQTVSEFNTTYNVYVIKDMSGKVVKSINWRPPQI